MLTLTPPSPSTLHWSSGGASPGVDAAWADAAAAVADRLAEQAARHDRDGSYVADEMELLRRDGFTSMLVPTELGGAGATYADVVAVLATLAHGDPASALTLSMHSHLVAAQVWRHHQDLPAPALPKVAAGAVLVSTGAADWVGSSGTTSVVDGGYRVSGTKSPASGCLSGDVLVSSMRWDDAPDGPQVLHFSVPLGAEGITIEPTWDSMGMRGTGSHTVVLSDVFVPDAAVALARPADVWHPVWNVVMGAAMPLIMAVYVGVAEAAVEQALTVAQGSHDPAGRAPVVGRMLNQLHVAQDALSAMVAMNDDLRFENTDQLAADVLSRKTAAADAAIQATRLAMEVAGGAGYARTSGIERLLRDVHAAVFHPLPAHRQEEFSGRVGLGLSPITT